MFPKCEVCMKPVAGAGMRSLLGRRTSFTIKFSLTLKTKSSFFLQFSFPFFVNRYEKLQGSRHRLTAQEFHL